MLLQFDSVSDSHRISHRKVSLKNCNWFSLVFLGNEAKQPYVNCGKFALKGKSFL